MEVNTYRMHGTRLTPGKWPQCSLALRAQAAGARWSPLEQEGAGPAAPARYRGLSLTPDTARQRASGSACLLGLRWHGWREGESQERWATGPTGAGQAGASHCLPLFSHYFRVRRWTSSGKMFQYLLVFLIGCSMRALIHSNLKTFIIKKSVQINSQKRDN